MIAVTSCTPDEGKSSICMQLSISLAESEKRVLLIDADLRKSVLMGRIKVDRQGVKGLTDFLSGQCSLKDTICATDIKNFFSDLFRILSAESGRITGRQKFRSMVASLREVYDYIIIDTPPLGSVIDSAVAAECCDGALIVIESGAISYRFIQEVKAQLEKSGCPILGAVLNKVDIQAKSYGKYGKYYGKYYGEKE